MLLSSLTLAASLSTIPDAVLPLHPYLAQQATLDAKIGAVPGTYLFDTGEGVTAISPAIARSVGCSPWGRITGFRMTGEQLGNPHCDDLMLVASGVSLPVPSAITLDIMALIGAGVPHIDGAIGLDAFVGRIITIVPRTCIVIESPGSLRLRIASAKALPVHLVRDAEGVALSVDAAVPTRMGTAWFELDSGNGGSFVIANYLADLFGLSPDISTPVQASFPLANGILVAGPTRTRNLIMDGNIGARFLNRWNLTLDLARGRAWLAPNQ